MQPATIDELFAQTLQGDYDNDDAWKAIHRLQSIGTREVFEKAADWCRSEQPLKRVRGVDILSQLGRTAENFDNPFPDETFGVLTTMLESETDPGPLSSILAALGHLKNPAAIPLILPFSYHPDRDVRFDLAFALGCFADDERSVSTLLKLMTDKDSEVRDWATFGLGNLGDFDSPKIREALFKNLTDEDEDVREEAMVGLAKRKDLRSLNELMSALKNAESSPRALEAASFLLERTSNPIEDPSACLEALRQSFPSQS
jgi:HEAT repeat protein